MLIRENTRARFGATECDGRPGVPVHCHSLPSSPAMFHVSSYYPSEFDGRLLGALPLSLFGTLFYLEFVNLITFRLCSALSDLTAYLSAESSNLGGWCFTLRAWRGLFNFAVYRTFL